MKGTNPVAGPMHDENGDLIVNSIWPTIQGEGPDAGRPAVFIRLAHCNLRCHFCDTEFETGEKMTVDQIFAKVTSAVFEPGRLGVAKLVVITGGEPLLQNIIPLVRVLNSVSMEVAVETAGTVYVDGLDKVFDDARNLFGNIIVCSPKTPRLNEKLVPLIGAYKYVLRMGEADPEDGLPSMSTQSQNQFAKLFRPDRYSHAPIFLQPCDEGNDVVNRKNLELVSSVCMKFGYRMSVQLHKVAGLP